MNKEQLKERKAGSGKKATAVKGRAKAKVKDQAKEKATAVKGRAKAKGSKRDATAAAVQMHAKSAKVRSEGGRKLAIISWHVQPNRKLRKPMNEVGQ